MWRFLLDEKFLKNKNIKYQGGDIVEELVEELKTKYESSNNKFLSIDITRINYLMLIYYYVETVLYIFQMKIFLELLIILADQT